MTRMAEKGKAKFEAKKAAWERRAAARAGRLRSKGGKEAWAKLERLFEKAKEHGTSTKERLLDFIGERFGESTERAEFVLWEVSKHALRAKDPLAELNQQLNAEAAKAANEVTVDPALFVKSALVDKGGK